MVKFSELAGPTFDPGKVHPNVARFYEETNAYERDAWTEWCGVFRPLGWMLAVLFSRRLGANPEPDKRPRSVQEALSLKSMLTLTCWWRMAHPSGVEPETF
jgi:hypothetical protein